MATTSSNKARAICMRFAIVAVSAVALAFTENEMVRAQPGSVQMGYQQPGYGGGGMPAGYAPPGDPWAAQYASYTPHGVPIPAGAEQLQAQWMAASYGAAGMGGAMPPIDGMGSVDCMDGAYDDGPYGGGSGRLITAHRYDDHYVGVKADFLHFQRANDSLRYQPITSDGVMGHIVLDAADTFLDDSSGARVSAYFDFFHSFDLEMSWFGGLSWSESATATSPTNSLFSVYSDFGVAPNQGFEETDQATSHSISYDSELENFEMNARWRWAHTTMPITGAWIAGVRYLKLKERFRHTTFALGHTDPILGGGRGPGRFDNIIDTENDLVGFQFGGEAMVAIVPRLLVGVDAEVGIYGNSAKMDNNVAVGINKLGPPDLLDERERGQTAFVGEANATATYRLVNEIYLRGGYQVLVVEGVALAPASFNAASPFVLPRPSVFDTNGNLLLHGFHVGVEAQW